MGLIQELAAAAAATAAVAAAAAASAAGVAAAPASAAASAAASVDAAAAEAPDGLGCLPAAHSFYFFQELPLRRPRREKTWNTERNGGGVILRSVL